MQNILIIGTGALATMFAARFAGAGKTVTMLGTWKNGIEALIQGGACLVEADGSGAQFPVWATSNPAEIKKVDLAFVLVKAWQTRRVAQQILESLPGFFPVVTLQNGLGNREILAEKLGYHRVILGSTTSGATLLEPGMVRAAGDGITSLEQSRHSAEICTLIQKTGMTAEIVQDADSIIWGKLVINSAINPLTALLRIPNGHLLENSSARQVMSALAMETTSVAGALGVHLPFADPIQFVEEAATKTATNYSSMLQDIRRGAHTEIDAICGAITRLGNQHGRPVPHNWLMWQLVQALENK